MKRPNVIFAFADQWRAQAAGYAGDPNVRTPTLDALAADSINVTGALSGCPVCSPYRASLMTGRHPLTHGVFVNDVCLMPQGPTLAETFKAAGYDTAYIGKWHLDGHGRSAFIPPERRRGFDYWKALECTHDYNHSAYYAGDSAAKLIWHGYDALAQTEDAVRYIRGHGKDKPFFLALSWGPPHDPYGTAPAEFKRLYDPPAIRLRPNVPPEAADKAREWLCGYYAHCSALDSCVGRLLDAIARAGIENDSIFVFTSDHGDMVGSHGHRNKQRPWDESIRVPFLLRWPGMPGWRPRRLDAPLDAPDIMPTLLGLCGLPVPPSVQGLDFSGLLRGDSPDPSDGAAILMCVQPFAQWNRRDHGGREFRGLRTRRHTYVRDLAGPWLLYDNESDPYQMKNLVSEPAYRLVRDQLDARLSARLTAAGDEFLSGPEYMRRWGYPADETGAVPYSN